MGVDDELRQLAATRLIRDANGHTLQAMVLVHGAYLRMVGYDAPRRFAAAPASSPAAEAIGRHPRGPGP